VEDPALAVSLAKAARMEVAARYTWTRHVNAILERMNDLSLRQRDAGTAPTSEIEVQ
jgi:hypothetical protein